MQLNDLLDLKNFLEQRNSRVLNTLKIKLISFINENEEAFFDAVLGEQKEHFSKLLPLIQEISYDFVPPARKNFLLYITYKPGMPPGVISLDYPPKDFFIPLHSVIVRYQRIQNFPKFDELKSQCEAVDYFNQSLLDLKRFLDREHPSYTLLELLRTYPELYEYTKNRFKFKTPPFQSPEKLKQLPEHLGDYVRKVQFMEKTLFD
jgi:hypothetical protein